MSKSEIERSPRSDNMSLNIPRNTLPSTLTKFCHGFFSGSLIGGALLAYGTLAWGVSVMLGIEKLPSSSGTDSPPVLVVAVAVLLDVIVPYVLFFGLAGATVEMFHTKNYSRLEAVFGWSAGVIIVFGGCFLIVATVSEHKAPWVPIWEVIGFVLFVALAVTAFVERRRRSTQL